MNHLTHHSKFFLLLVFSSIVFWACQPKPAEPVADITPKAIEFADAKYIEMGKQAMTKLAQGDVDGYLSNYADNAVMQWNNGDSIATKTAIATYWKEKIDLHQYHSY